MRGSIPCPGASTLRYGGNTSCLTIESGGNHLLVLDAGTGIRELGRHLRERSGPIQADILLTHFHWDHIHGLPFFLPAYGPENRLRVLGPRQQRSLRSLLDHQMTWEMFPIAPSAQVGIREVVELDGEPFSAGGCEVQGFRLCHPGVTLGYRVVPQGVRPVAYVPDNELAGAAHGVTSSWRTDLVDFLREVDTLVHDSTWSDDPAARVAGWGHSTVREAVELARDTGCRRLVLFHHNPEHHDQAMDRLVERARIMADSIAPGLNVVAAIEGETLELECS